MWNIKRHIDLLPNVKPRFCRAQPAPYALLEKVNVELDRLISSRIYRPVSHSRWAALIVPVLKKDGTIR